MSDLVNQFETLDPEETGHVTMETMTSMLSNMKTSDGQDLDDKDVEMLLKTSKNEDKIVLGDFIAIMYRLRIYRKAKGKWRNKMAFTIPSFIPPYPWLPAILHMGIITFETSLNY